MRPLSGKRLSLKSRCSPASGAPDERALRRLRHRIGPTQLREILLGLSDPDREWREFCHDLLEQQYPILTTELLDKVADAYRELHYPSAKSNQRDDLLSECTTLSARGREELRRALHERVDAGGLTSKEAELLIRRREWQQVALAAAGFLLRLGHAEGLSACRQWLIHGSKAIAADFAQLLSGSAQGVRAIDSSLTEVPACRLLVILRAVDREPRKRLLKAAARRVYGLSGTRDLVTPDLVDAARLCLPKDELATWCLDWLGPFPSDETVALAALRCLREADDAVRASMVPYLELLLELERELGQRDAQLQGQPELTREAMQQAYRRKLAERSDLHWTVHQGLHFVLVCAAEDRDARERLRAAIAAAQGQHVWDIVNLLVPAAGEHLDCLMRQIVPLLPLEGAAHLWIEGLRAHDEGTRRECVNRLKEMGRDALPGLLLSLERHPNSASVAMHVLQALPGLSSEELSALHGTWQVADGEGKAALSIMLALYDPAGFGRQLRHLYRSPEAVLRGAAAYAAQSAGCVEDLPGLFCLLLDPHPEISAAARRSLLCWPDPEGLRSVLSRALSSHSEALRREALHVLVASHHSALLPLLGSLARDGLFDAIDMALAAELAQGGLSAQTDRPPQFVYSLFRLPVRFPHWRQYWHRVRRSPELLKAFHQENLLGTISDDLYLQVRSAVQRGQSGSHALWRDLADDVLSGLREAFERYHGRPVSDEQWAGATVQALQTVDERYLREEWERGQPELKANDPSVAQWEMALWWEVETQLLADLPEGRTEPCPEGFPGEEWGGAVEREWQWLSQFPNWQWGFTVRPRVPIARLVEFVLSHWPKVSGAPETFAAQVVREVLDYCALWGYAFPGHKQWRAELREALWACYGPLRRAILKREPKDRSSKVHGALEATPEESLDHLFQQVLEEWNPFFGSPEEPPIPIGLLGARVGRKPLPQHIYGRGVPFTQYLKTRLDKLLGKTAAYDLAVPDFDRTAAEDDADSEDDADRPDLQVQAVREPDAGWARLLVQDEEGQRWLPLAGLEEKTGVSSGQLLGERDRGFLQLEKRRHRLFVRYDEHFDDLCAELQRRAVLRRVASLARELKLTPAQTGRRKKQLLATHTTAETLAQMQRLSQ